jgi:glycosyltransferase involved in cell wall biosynthesis
MSQKMNGSPKISVIVCARNEADNLPHVLPKIPDWIDEVILIDGHSSDSTIETAKKICPQVRILNQPGQGKGNAIKYGVNHAVGDIIVTLDADGQTNPADISRFIEPVARGYDLAKGTRFARGRPVHMPFYRWLGNQVLVMTSNILFKTQYTDICSGFNAFWKQSFLRLELVNDGFELEQEMNVKAWKKGLKVIEVNHEDCRRLGSSSKVSSIKQGFKDLWTIIKERFH